MEKKRIPIITKHLKEFFKENSYSSLKKSGRGYVISHPWGDPTLVLKVSNRNVKLLDTLNNIILPPRFTCIYHRDTKDIEFIYTALPIPPPMRDRSFIFSTKERNYKCEFGNSSERLLVLAASSSPIEAPSETIHRNLFDFNLYLHYCREHPESEVAKQGKPTSFWIRDVDYDENLIVNLSRHLNFFMKYFDPHTPQIMIHTPDIVEERKYINPFKRPATFPGTICGRIIEPTLLALWESANLAADPFRKYLYKYQIIEYCSFYHLQDDILRSIKKSLAMPNIIDKSDDIARNILETLTEDRMDEPRKLIAVLERFVDPKKLWDVIHPNSKYYANPVEFDGGLKIEPIISEKWSFDDFKTAWSPKVPDTLRMIRNGLVHARERRMVKNIAPTRRNRGLLRPWLDPLMVASMELMVYGD